MPFLDWVNKNEAKQAAAEVPFHLLRHESSHGDVSGAYADNLLIQGDNLAALKSLLPFYAGRVRCIYIDPPYNTQAAFSHYDDRLEHSQWLTTLYPRLQLLAQFLTPDGSLWASIDNREGHYLKVLLDEVFGRKRFVTTCVWQQRTTRENRKVFSEDAEYIHVYALDPAKFKAARNKLKLTQAVLKRYKNPDNDSRGPWQSVSANAQDGHATEDQFYDYVAPNGKVHKLPPGRCWLYTERRMAEEVGKNNIWHGKKGNGVPRIKMFLSDDVEGLVPETLWLAKEVGTNDQAKKEIVKLSLDAEVFDTPKPESLIARVLEIATNPGDLVLDSFLGSGTTAAVAHKLGRRYVGIEMGDHARTHALPRLDKVIAGEDGGVSGRAEWKGGGGFRFCTLGDPAFAPDGRIRPGIPFGALAAYLWHLETGVAAGQNFETPCLGLHGGIAYYLLFNGILGDRRPAGGNVLTHDVLRAINDVFPHDGPRVVYGELSRLGPARLAAEQITFKQIPYEIHVR